MKKTVVGIMTLVLVLSLSMVALVACNDTDDTQAVSNSEVLGTTVAVLAQNALGSTASTSADEGADANFNAGVNLTLGDSNSLSFGGEAIVSGLGAMVKPVLQSAVNNVKNLLNENGVTVGKVDCTDADFDEKYEITITYVDEESATESTYKLALYIKVTTDGAEVEGTKAYNFNAKVTFVKDIEGATSEISVTEFSGKANFDTAKDAMIFTLGADAGDDFMGGFANIKAYGTAKGSVVVEMGAGAGIQETLGASASLSIELGKLDDGKFGAVVVATGKAGVESIADVDFVATINVHANSTDNAGEFAINGSVEANVSVDIPVLGTQKFKGTANLEGKAKYDADKDEAVVGIGGTINFAKVEDNQNA